jgi:hypothetical protein
LSEGVQNIKSTFQKGVGKLPHKTMSVLANQVDGVNLEQQRNGNNNNQDDTSSSKVNSEGMIDPN